MVRVQNLCSETTSTINVLVIFTLFVASLQQYSLTIAGGGVTANYVYLLIPFVFWISGIKRRLVKRKEVFQLLFVYSLIYIIGFPGDFLGFNDDLRDPFRRLASFLVFLFPLLLSFVEFKRSDIDIFKAAVIFASVYYSFETIIRFASLSDFRLYALKGMFGSQRYGFILCLGFFIALFNDKLIFEKWIFLQRVFISSIILIGMIFTFSRSTIVSIVGGLIFLLGLILFKKKKRIDGNLVLQSNNKKFKPIYFVVLVCLIVSIFIVFQAYYDVNFLEFYQARFIDPLLDSTLMESTLESDPNSSEGFRYYVLIRILDYLALHPLTGSNYQGLYLLYDEFSDGASTHNQYTDIFLRTGLIGGLLWLYLLYRVVRFCNNDKGLQVGIVSILIYGLFHETFKLSQGSFIFGMLLSFSYMKVSLKRTGQPLVQTSLRQI